MNKKLIFVVLLMMGIFFMSHSAMADGKYGGDITVSGKVEMAIIDDTTGKVYILQPESKSKSLPATIKVGEKATLFGDQITNDNYNSLRVEEVK